MNSTKPRIAIVRGHHLSKEETLSYESLRDEFDFVCLSTNNPWFDHSEIVFPILNLPGAERFWQFLPGNIANRMFGLADGLLGIGQWMIGLEQHLSGFDIVHSSDYCHLFTYQAALAKKRLGYKLVAIHYDNIPFARDSKPAARHVKYRTYEKVDAFFAMSERARASLELEGVDSNRIFVIGNSVDTHKFRPRPEENHEWRERLNIRPTDIVILFVGRVRASKGVFELIYATKRLLEDRQIDSSRLQVIIAGRGPRERQLHDRIRDLQIEKNVRLIGSVPHAEIHLLHNMADIFVLPSIPRKYWQEQFGIVLIESMACAKPVISTLSGSIPEVIGDSGILVQPNDHFSLSESLKRLILDSRLRNKLGKKARERALNLFDTRTVGKKLSNAYHTLLERH